MIASNAPILSASALVCAIVCLLSCGQSDRPLDAKTRRRIDSLMVAESRKAEKEVDSLCALYRSKDMARMVDSIRQVREARIRESLNILPE